MIRLKEDQTIHGRLFRRGETFPLVAEESEKLDKALTESDTALELSLVMQDKADQIDEAGKVVDRRAELAPKEETTDEAPKEEATDEAPKEEATTIKPSRSRSNPKEGSAETQQ
jgi:hypothetical protein